MNAADYIQMWTTIVTEMARDLATSQGLDQQDKGIIQKLRFRVLREPFLLKEAQYRIGLWRRRQGGFENRDGDTAFYER